MDISKFSKFKQEYYASTKNFWDSFLRLRSAARAKQVGNKKLVDRLLGDLK